MFDPVPDPAVFWYLGGFFGALVLAGFSPLAPPEEVVVAGAGVWVGASPNMGPVRWLALPVCILGILLADVMLYGIGRRWGNRLLEHRWFARLLTPEKRAQIEGNLQHYGLRVLLFVRWVPGIRSPMFLTAGTMRLLLSRFIVADAAAAVVGHTCLFFLAWWFGDVVKDLIEKTEAAAAQWIHFALLLLLIAVVGGGLLIHLYRRPVTTANPKDVPLIGPKVAAKLESGQFHPEQRPCEERGADRAPADASRQPAP